MIINTLDHSYISEKMQRFQDYIQALQEERDKIQVFRRELPLCFELVTQAIETCKHQLSGTTTECNLRGQSECSEQTSCPVFEEFIPLKRASFQSDGEEQESQKKNKDLVDISNTDGTKNGNEKNSNKSDWLRSVQLWKQTPDPSSKEDSPRKVVVTEVKRNGGAFQPFKKEKSLGAGVTPTAPTQLQKNKSPPLASTSSTADTGGGSGGGNKKEDKEGDSLRKARRCWSPELHRRFVQVLHQLGGSHVATPKQIRELMKVDGLTNDEVKSHLQKYRLHTRRTSPSNQNNNNAQQTPQFVVVGGIWMPPEYAAMATTTTSTDAPTTTAGIYAPVASLAQPFREASAFPNQMQLHSDDRGSHSGEGGIHGSHSPATSSSTHTTTASPSY